MRIERVELAGHPVFQDSEVSFATPAPGGRAEVVTLVGGPGSGKSAFLETVVAAKEDAAPTGARGALPLAARDRNDSCKVRVGWKLTPAEQQLVGGEARRISELIVTDEKRIPDGDDDDGLRTILGGQAEEGGWFLNFDEERTLPPMSIGISAGRPRKASPRFVERSHDKFSFVSPFLIDLDNGSTLRDPSTWSSDAFNAALERGTGCRFVGLRRAGGIVPIFRFGKRVVTLAQLPSTTREWLIFLATFFYCRPTGSIVLIDAPEQRLGVEGAGRLLDVLRGLGEDNQLVVTTSSEALARATEGTVAPLPRIMELT